MKGLIFNEYTSKWFRTLLNDRDELDGYNENATYKDFLKWQESAKTFNSYYENYFRSVGKDKDYAYIYFADKEDEQYNAFLINEMLLDPNKLALSCGWEGAFGYDKKINENIETAVANGANIYQALASVATAKELLQPSSENGLPTEEIIDYTYAGYAEENLLEKEKFSPYHNLYQLSARLQYLQDQLEHPEHLSDEEYHKILDDIDGLQEDIDAEILEFEPEYLKSINDSRRNYFRTVGEIEKDLDRRRSASKAERASLYVARRIQSLERQNKFNNNENDIENE